MRPAKLFNLMAGLMLIGFVADAQTADDIVSRHITALGGPDLLKKISTQYSESMMSTAQGVNIKVHRWVKQNKNMRVEYETMGTKNIQVVTDNSGWEFMPIKMQAGPEPMDSTMVQMLKADFNIYSLLFDYKAKGKKVELIGRENDPGHNIQLYKLKVTNPDGTNWDVYIDDKRYYIAKVVSKMKVEDTEMEVTSSYSDYEKTPEGFIYAKTTEQAPIGLKTSIQKLEVNKPLDDNIFAMPPK